MTIVRIEPDTAHQIPYDMTEEKPNNILEELAVAGNTAELQVELGANLETSPEDGEREKALLETVLKTQKTQNLKLPNTAMAAAGFLRTYGQQTALDAVAARAAITNKLMEIANCGDTRYELKALELLGKHSDIGMFTERSEITVNYNSPKELENQIKERVKRLLNASVVDTQPLGLDLDEELGIAEAEIIEPALDDLKTEWGKNEDNT